MDRAMLSAQLEQAERHVAEGYRHVARQRRRVAGLSRTGQATRSRQSAQLLAQFEKLQAMHVADRLIRKLADATD